MPDKPVRDFDHRSVITIGRRHFLYMVLPHDRRAPVTSPTIRPGDPQLSPIIPGTIDINDIR
jgi:hypothetical protein